MFFGCRHVSSSAFSSLCSIFYISGSQPLHLQGPLFQPHVSYGPPAHTQYRNVIKLLSVCFFQYLELSSKMIIEPPDESLGITGWEPLINCLHESHCQQGDFFTRVPKLPTQSLFQGFQLPADRFGTCKMEF